MTASSSYEHRPQAPHSIGDALMALVLLAFAIGWLVLCGVAFTSGDASDEDLRDASTALTLFVLGPPVYALWLVGRIVQRDRSDS